MIRRGACKMQAEKLPWEPDPDNTGGGNGRLLWQLTNKGKPLPSINVFFNLIGGLCNVSPQ